MTADNITLSSDQKSHIISKKEGGIGYMKGTVIFHKPAKRFYVKVYWQGRQERFWSILWNKEWLPLYDVKTAHKLLGAIQADVDRGEFDPRSFRPQNPLSLGEYYTTWLASIEVTTKTKRDYRTAIVKYVIPILGSDTDLRKIRKADLVKLHVAIPGSDKWRYNVMGALKAMLHWAYQNEETSRVPPFPKLKQPEPASVEYLTMKQQEQVLVYIPEIHRSVFRFAMEYGLRIGEVRAIMKDAVKDGRISIKRAFSDNELRESTKTGDVRAYDLTPYAKKIIDELPAHFGPFVFVREDGKPYTNKNLNAIWQAACKQAGIRIKLYNAARHSLGCQLLDEGKDLSFVQEVLGHRRQEMTRRYARRTAKHVGNVLADRRRVVQLDDMRERKS